MSSLQGFVWNLAVCLMLCFCVTHLVQMFDFPFGVVDLFKVGSSNLGRKNSWTDVPAEVSVRQQFRESECPKTMPEICVLCENF